MARPKKYPEELIQRGIRLALESERPIAHIAADLGMHPETLRKKVRQHEADRGKRPDLPSSQEREEIRRLRQENYELRRANEILKSASVFSPRSSIQTGRSEPLRRRASRPFRGRADLSDLGRVGVRVLPAQDRRPVGAQRARRAAVGPDPGVAPDELTPMDRGGCGLPCVGPASRSRAARWSG
jgi:transposase